MLRMAVAVNRQHPGSEDRPKIFSLESGLTDMNAGPASFAQPLLMSRCCSVSSYSLDLYCRCPGGGMADAEDLKSSGDFSSCGFDSHPGHQSALLLLFELHRFIGVAASPASPFPVATFVGHFVRMCLKYAQCLRRCLFRSGARTQS